MVQKQLKTVGSQLGLFCCQKWNHTRLNIWDGWYDLKVDRDTWTKWHAILLIAPKYTSVSTGLWILWGTKDPRLHQYHLQSAEFSPFFKDL